MTQRITITTKPCFYCKKSSQVEVLKGDYVRWKNGEKIQYAFSETTPDFRELLISGTHPACWDAMFPGNEDDEDDEDLITEDL